MADLRLQVKNLEKLRSSINRLNEHMIQVKKEIEFINSFQLDLVERKTISKKQ